MVEDIPGKATVVIFIAILLVSGMQLAHAPQKQILDPTIRPESQNSLSQYVGHPQIDIISDSDFASLGFNGNGSSTDPFIIEWLIISAGSYSIQVYNTSAHFTIRNCYLVAGVTGIYLDYVSNAIIEDCIISRGNQAGIRFSRTNFSVINNCSISQNDIGISIEYSNNCTIVGNTVHQNVDGLALAVSENATIRDNIVYGNERRGISLNNEASDNFVFNNTVGWNGRGLEDVTPIINAEDDGQNNQWDFQGIGNQWSNYHGEGLYEIQGSANANDNYPLMLNDSQDPIVDGIDDVNMDLDDEGFTIRWNVTETYPLLYRIYRDGDRTTYYDWSGESVDIEFIDFTIGFYNFTVQFEDCAGNLANDTVVILVYMNMFGGTGTYYILFGSIASILAVVFVVIILKKVR